MTVETQGHSLEPTLAVFSYLFRGLLIFVLVMMYGTEELGMSRGESCLLTMPHLSLLEPHSFHMAALIRGAICEERETLVRT